MESSKWPQQGKHIAEVFLPADFDKAKTSFQDISTNLNILENCRECPLNIRPLCRQLRKDRNEIAHGKTEISQNRKNAVFQNIRNLIIHPDILQTLANYPQLPQLINDLEHNQLFDYRTELQTAVDELGAINKKLDTTFAKHALNLEHVGKAVNIALLSIIVAVVAVVVAMCLAVGHHDWNGLIRETYREPTMNEGCITEQPNHMRQSEISLRGYLLQHQKFTGRQWLLSKLENELLSTDTSTHGVLLLAEMGYGKSAIVAHIICALFNETGYAIRHHIVAYHLCRFDVMKTKRIDTFIRRMVSMISMRLPELEPILGSCNIYLEENECQGDPFGCIDQCLIFPLSQINNEINPTMVIAFDALDECEDTSDGSNRMFDLLKYAIHRFPRWIRFLVTSENVSRNYTFKNELKIITLEGNDQNNINDGKMYLNQYVKASDHIISQIGDNNLWNFQFLSSISDSNVTDINSEQIPQSQDRSYERQFRRLFGDNYTDAKMILELICSTFRSTTETNLWQIVSSTSTISNEQFRKRMQQLHCILTQLNGEFRIRHISLRWWLESLENIYYKIDTANGHFNNALFLLNSIRSGAYEYKINIIDIAIHVSRAADAEHLIAEFNNLTYTEIKHAERNFTEYPLHRLARKENSYFATKILLNQFQNVNKLNQQNVTASYIAAALGNAKTLEALVEHDADINFRVKDIPELIEFDLAVQVTLEHGYWGFGLLDIASQNGHIDVVRYIIINNGILFNYWFDKYNGLNLLPIHMACKFGHTEIVKELSQYFKWMVDDVCLYQSSERNNVDLVNYLLTNGVVDVCRKCDDNLFWIPANKTRVQGRTISCDTATCGKVLFDDWNLITCETALHVAVRRNNIGVVKVLVFQKKNALRCFDRGGRTPLIAAIQYNAPEIVRHILEVNSYYTDGCTPAPNITDIMNLNKNEITKLGTYFCEKGARHTHIAAKYNRRWFAELSEGVETGWNETDANGCQPVHYAACHGSIDMLNYLRYSKNVDFESVMCYNKSSPFHVAVICGSVVSVQFIKDAANIVKLHKYAIYAVSQEMEEPTALKSEDAQVKFGKIMNSLIDSENDLIYQDISGRNIFHKAILNGHHMIISNVLLKYPKTSLQLLFQKDTFGKTPLKHSLEKLPKKSTVYFQVDRLFPSVNDILEEPESKPLVGLMSPKEYSIYQTCLFLKKYPGTSELFSDEIRQLLIQKSLDITYFELYKSNRLFRETARWFAYMIENDPSGTMAFQTVVYYFSDLIVHFFKKDHITALFEHLKQFDELVCGEPLRDSFHHLLSLHYEKVKKIIGTFGRSEHLPSATVVLPLYFREKISSCYDSDGFNILERSIQGGNKEFVRYLLDTRLAESKRTTEDLLRMAIVQLSYLKKDKFVTNIESAHENVYKMSVHEQNWATCGWCKEYSSNNYDSVVQLLLDRFHHQISTDFICFPNARNFSYVHICAIQGLTESLKRMVTYWGIGVLSCLNQHKFTPLYLARMFNNNETVLYIESKIIKPAVLPMTIPEIHFVFKLMSRMSLSQGLLAKLKCLFDIDSNPKRALYIRDSFKAVTCVNKVAKTIKTKDSGILQDIHNWRWMLVFASYFDSLRYFMDNDINIHFLRLQNDQSRTGRACNWIGKATLKLVVIYKRVFNKCKVSNAFCRKMLKHITRFKEDFVFSDCLYMVEPTIIKRNMFVTLTKQIKHRLLVFRNQVITSIIPEHLYKSQFYLKRLQHAVNLKMGENLKDHPLYKYMDIIEKFSIYHDIFVNSKDIKDILTRTNREYIRMKQATEEIMKMYVKTKSVDSLSYPLFFV